VRRSRLSCSSSFESDDAGRFEINDELPQFSSTQDFSAQHISATMHARDLRTAMSTLPACPQCKSDLTYQDGQVYVCPECAHEWSAAAAAPLDESAESENAVRDANGSILQDGDTVIVVKDLPVKGASSALKAGTKVKGIRLVEGDHNIDCRIEGFGGMRLKSAFVKKA
jgi:protein PhnA